MTLTPMTHQLVHAQVAGDLTLTGTVPANFMMQGVTVQGNLNLSQLQDSRTLDLSNVVVNGSIRY